MQPASSTGGGSSAGNRNLKKWGPIAAIVAVVAVVVGVLAFSGGGDEGEDTDPTTAPTGAPATDAPDDTTDDNSGDTTPPSTDGTEPTTTEPPAGGEITYPLSFTQAQEQGIEVEWADTCDVERGTIAVPDFFAPDCYAPFEGDNGGETASGVTGDSIKIVVYQGPDDDPVISYITSAITVEDSNAEEEEVIRDMYDYYGTYYELYGRTVDVEFFTGSGIANDEVSARADAVRIAEDIQPFAVVGGPTLTSAFADELAARGIVCISCTPGQDTSWYQERDPYVWSIGASAKQAQSHVLEFIGAQLVGKPAEFAGDEEFTTTERRFGLVYIESSQASTDLADAFADGMEELGAPLAERTPYVLDPGSIQASASQAIAKLKAAGVTTVIFSGDPVAPGNFTREATAQGYFPEWLIANSALVDTTAFARTYDQEQWQNAFGITTLAARQNPETSGYYNLYRWWTGQEPAAPDSIGVFMPGHALLHAVLQGAGPDLTPETFKTALFQGRTDQAISQPFLTWGEQGIWEDPDYSGIDDATLIWWDPTATGVDEIRREGTGMYQYVDGGTRYLPGEWTTEEKLFDPEGAVTIYETPPPGETPPEYPSPAG